MRTFSTIEPPLRTFWNFFVSRREASFGLSMPIKTLTKFASVINCMSCSSSARSNEASVKNISG